MGCPALWGRVWEGDGHVPVIDKVIGALASARILAFFLGHFHHTAFCSDHREFLLAL